MAITQIPGPSNKIIDFTSSGTWVCPAGVFSAEFLVVGAGGGGGGADNSTSSYVAVGGGGGGGAVKQSHLAVTPGSSYTITVGAKGTSAIGAAGTNGGFSEVVLGGTTLMRSFGGQGGSGKNSADATVSPTLTLTMAGVGGNSTRDSANTERHAKGGGGAIQTSVGAGSPEGSDQGLSGISGFGIGNYGHGGGGGSTSLNLLPGNYSAAPYGAGLGARNSSVSVATDTAGGDATFAGCGGGGGASSLSTTGASGGNGADGLVRITYFG